MYKRLRKCWAVILSVCLILSVVPAEALAADRISTAVGEDSTVNEGTAVKDEGAVIAPEAALLADCQILRYVNEEAFREKNHVSRVPGEETLSSYVFQNADGSRTVYFLDEPVKYVDSAGIVREKDLTLKAVGPDNSLMLDSSLASGGSQAVSGYVTTANDIGLTLPTNPSDGICLTYEGSRITLIPQGGTQGVTAQLAEGGVNYPDFFGEGMSLRYTPLLSGVKEDIILRAYTGVNTFTFLLNTGGLGLYEENGRYYVASSPDAENPLELGDLVTFDAHGRFSVGTTTAQTLTPNQSYRLTLTVDEAFLTDENTTYPVTIDPTVRIENSSTSDNSIQDTTIYSGAPNLNGNWTYLHSGYYDDTYKVARTLFRFPALIDSDAYSTPSKYEIISVNFHITEATGSAPVEVGVYAITSTAAWNESTVTWNNANLTITESMYANGLPSYGDEEIYSITNLVKAWQDGVEDPDCGLMLKSSNETSVDKAFYSSEWSNSDYRPYLEMTYMSSDVSLNYTTTDIDVGTTVDLDADGFPVEPIWSSSDTTVATVNSSGVVTGIKPGNATISARLNGYQRLYCTVYVTIADAVYYIQSNTGTCLAVDGSLDSGAPVKLVTKSNVSGHAKIRQLWKIKHIDSGYYSIRSLYKSDRCVQVTSNTAKLLTVGTNDYLSTFPTEALWKIEQVSGGYVLQNCETTVNKLCLRPSDTNAVISSYISSHPGFTWTLTPDTAVPNLMLLIDTETCYPVTGSFHTLYEGERATLEDLGLMVSYVSQHTNDMDYYWQTSGSDEVGITNYDEVVVYGRGETVFSVHASGSTNTPMYFIVHSPYVDDGAYYIRNWYTNSYIEVSGDSVYGDTFSPDSSQLWNITYLGNREYSIRSIQSPYYYLGINVSSPLQGAPVTAESGSLTAGMRWTFTKVESGAFKISAQCAPDLVIKDTDVYGDDTIRQYSYNDSEFQYSEWLLCEPNSQIMPEDQEEDHWCWVACAKIASTKFMNSPISQRSAAFYVRCKNTKIARNLDPSIDGYPGILDSGYAEDTLEALEYILGWEGGAYSPDVEGDLAALFVYTENILIQLLDEGNVVIAGRQRTNGSGGHAYVIYDYTYNTDIEKNQFLICDPWMESESNVILRTYEWICDGQDAYYTEHQDTKKWEWLVTLRIGPYDQHTKIVF